MSEPVKSSWWHTLPGVLTALAAVLTALAGLLAAARQAGWLGAAETSAPTSASVSAPAPAPQPAAQAAAPPTAAPLASAALQHLPWRGQLRLGEQRHALLGAQVEIDSAGQALLRLRLRLHNEGPYPVPFYDEAYRLLVDGLPRAPVGGLGEVVPGRAVAEGEVQFRLERWPPAQPLRLRVQVGDQQADLPLQTPLVQGS